MTYKQNKAVDEYTPLWVKLTGGLIVAGIGAMLGVILSYNMIVWYIQDCEYKDSCVVYQLMQKL